MLTTHLAGIMLAEEGLSLNRDIPKTLKWHIDETDVRPNFKHVLWGWSDWHCLHLNPCTQDDWPIFAY